MKDRVREITLDEIPELIEVLKIFEQCSCFVEVDMDVSIDACVDRMSSGAGTVFGLYDREGKIIGGLGCLKTTELTTGKPVAVETFWFVKPGSRGNGLKLFKAFEKWADQQDCKKRAMIHMVDLHPEVLKRFYEDNGYRLAEMYYVKEK